MNVIHLEDSGIDGLQDFASGAVRGWVKQHRDKTWRVVIVNGRAWREVKVSCARGPRAAVRKALSLDMPLPEIQHDRTGNEVFGCFAVA